MKELELMLAEAAVVAVAAWVDLLLAEAVVVAVSASLGVAGVLELCRGLLLAKPQRVLMEVAMAQCHPALLARLEQLTMVDVEALCPKSALGYHPVQQPWAAPRQATKALQNLKIL